MIQPIVRLATDDDVRAFYDGPLPLTVKAWVADLDGKVIGIAGMVYDHGMPAYLFAGMKPEMKRYKRTIVRASKMVLDAFRHVPAGAFVDPKIPNARRFLEHLGFRFVIKANGYQIMEINR